MPVSQETLDRIALSREEYALIVEKLDREPNEVELGLFGALWSEHCGYKHSKPLLRLFPTRGAAVRVEAGQENAGSVDIGDGFSVVFKVESHNHPSAVEPYQGAATGVGGIVRDILAMGARPIALLNSLRFGPLTDARNRYLFEGVVAGISGYGNCIGVPDVGGEAAFAPSYSGNPLLNAMCVGLLPDGQLMRAAATTPGALLVSVGSATGRDGIHGASGLASRSFGSAEDEAEREMRPTVQVGDPFLEKVLIEACLEAARSGHLEGLQDMGAAGLTSSAIECAERGGTGVEIDVDAVPRRERGMSAYEVMLSESQERMLLIVKEGREAPVREIFERWDIEASVIGRVTSDRMARVIEGGRVVAEVDVGTLVDAPLYTPDGVRPAYLDILNAAALPPEPSPSEAGRILRSLLSSPNIASKRSVYRRYDHEVQTNTMVKPGAGDAAVLRIRGAGKAIAVAIDGNGRHAYLDPYAGGAMAVAEACRNRRMRRRRAACRHRLPQFRRPTEPGGLLPARAVHPGHRRGLRRVGCAGGQRQRLALQRVRGRGNLPHARGRRGRSAPRRFGAPYRRIRPRRRRRRAAGRDRSWPRDVGAEASTSTAFTGWSQAGPPSTSRRKPGSNHSWPRWPPRESSDRRTTAPTAVFAVALAECAVLGGRGLAGQLVPVHRQVGRHAVRRGAVPHRRQLRRRRAGERRGARSRGGRANEHCRQRRRRSFRHRRTARRVVGGVDGTRSRADSNGRSPGRPGSSAHKRTRRTAIQASRLRGGWSIMERGSKLRRLSRREAGGPS